MNRTKAKSRRAVCKVCGGWPQELVDVEQGCTVYCDGCGWTTPYMGTQEASAEFWRLYNTEEGEKMWKGREKT